MKLSVLALCLATIAPTCYADPLSIDLRAEVIPVQHDTLSLNGQSLTKKFDGFGGGLRVNDGDYHLTANYQTTDAKLCGSCAKITLDELRAGYGVDFHPSPDTLVTPHVEYFKLTDKLSGTSINENHGGFTVGADGLIRLAEPLDAYATVNYIKLEDAKGEEGVVGMKLRTHIVDLFIEGRVLHLNFDTASDNLRTTELRVGVSKNIGF